MTPKKQHGLTLLEVMVALAIGVFMLTGILSMVVTVSTTRVDLNKTSEQIENGRYALHVFSEQISLAGFYGQTLLGSRSFTKPDPCSTTTSGDLMFEWDVTDPANPVARQPLPVFGYKAGATLPTCLDDAVVGSEALVLNMVDTTPISPVDLDTDNVPYVQYSACDIGEDPMVFGTNQTDFTLTQRDCSTDAALWRYKTLILYRSGCSDCDANDGIPTLKIEELQGPQTVSSPLVEGVEDMHFQYGLDFDDDGAPDCYVDDPEVDTNPGGCPDWKADDVESWSNVVSVRVNLLVRSIETVGQWTDTRTYNLGRAAAYDPPDDNYKRQVYSTVVTIPNVSGIRE